MQAVAQSRPRWWLWPTILSLDAPVVAVLWQALLARCASAPVRPAESFVLGCSVWLAYSADRWIEAWRLDPSSISTYRHRFHLARRWPIAAVWVLLLAADLTAALGSLSMSQFKWGLILLVPVALYLLSHQLVHRRSPWRAPKELCVALLMGAGASVFAAGRPGAQVGALAAPLALFVLLCFCNCALIGVWEDEVDKSHGETSLALQLGKAAWMSRALPWIAAAAALVLAAAGGPASRGAPACAAASGVLLGLVDLAEARIGRATARVLADVALMTPAVLLALGGRP